MNFFISHSSANGSIAVAFTELIKSIISKEDLDDIFCSSFDGSIGSGKDFIRLIVSKLNNCDAFIPLISDEYYKSRFSMIELGIACGKYFNNEKNQAMEHLYPFAVFPTRSSYALSGTPINNLHVANINSEDDLYKFFTDLSVDRGVRLLPNIRNKISAFVTAVDRILLESHDIISNAETDTFIDDSGYYKNRADIVQHSIADNDITVNFNLDPEEKNVEPTSFFSLALMYIDALDLGRYLEIDNACSFDFALNNFTNSLKAIDVEFKRGDVFTSIIKKFTLPIEPGMNMLHIPLSEMKYEALHNITQICFVVHPKTDVVEPEGMFKISDVKVRFGSQTVE